MLHNGMCLLQLAIRTHTTHQNVIYFIYKTNFDT